MSLNKEMLFGLAFGGDDMKWPIVDSSEKKIERINPNTTYTLEKDVMLEYYGFHSSRKIEANITIEFPDGSSITKEWRYNPALFCLCPKGTKFITTNVNYLVDLRIDYYDILGYLSYNP